MLTYTLHSLRTKDCTPHTPPKAYLCPGAYHSRAHCQRNVTHSTQNTEKRASHSRCPQSPVFPDSHLPLGTKLLHFMVYSSFDALGDLQESLPFRNPTTGFMDSTPWPGIGQPFHRQSVSSLQFLRAGLSGIHPWESKVLSPWCTFPKTHGWHTAPGPSQVLHKQSGRPGKVLFTVPVASVLSKQIPSTGIIKL